MVNETRYLYAPSDGLQNFEQFVVWSLRALTLIVFHIEVPPVNNRIALLADPHEGSECSPYMKETWVALFMCEVE